MKKLTPILFVDAIEPCLPFWTERLGFTKATEVPHDGRLGFVILVKDGLELMYQTWDSAAADVSGAARHTTGRSAASARSTCETPSKSRHRRSLSASRTAVGRFGKRWRASGRSRAASPSHSGAAPESPGVRPMNLFSGLRRMR